tara:strand:+ start:482 stop:808 length:327 start_codon:yes stop_codon:yes gene_type:complete
MSHSITLDEIIKGWLGFSDPSQERNLYAGKRMDDLVPFDDGNVSAGSQYWERVLGWLDGRWKRVFIRVDRGEKVEVFSLPFRLAMTFTLLWTMHAPVNLPSLISTKTT